MYNRTQYDSLVGWNHFLVLNTSQGLINFLFWKRWWDHVWVFLFAFQDGQVTNFQQLKHDLMCYIPPVGIKHFIQNPLYCLIHHFDPQIHGG